MKSFLEVSDTVTALGRKHSIFFGRYKGKKLYKIIAEGFLFGLFGAFFFWIKQTLRKGLHSLS